MSNTTPTEFQLMSARIEADADAEALRAALKLVDDAANAVESITLTACRHATAVAADDAGGLLSLAADELRGTLGLLGKVEDSDLAGELRDVSEAAQAVSREAV